MNEVPGYFSSFCASDFGDATPSDLRMIRQKSVYICASPEVNPFHLCSLELNLDTGDQ